MAFDALGYKLITGISLWASPGGSTNSSLLQQNPTMGPSSQNNNSRRDDSDNGPGSGRPQEVSGSGITQDIIVNSYQHLVQRYDSLVRNYQRLFMVRHRLTNTPPPPPNTVICSYLDLFKTLNYHNFTSVHRLIYKLDIN